MDKLILKPEHLKLKALIFITWEKIQVNVYIL